MPTIDLLEAHAVVDCVLAGAGVPPAHARLQRDLLFDAEMRGIASHGLLRLPRIVERIANGVADPETRGRHEWRSPGFLFVDGERGLGPVVAQAAIDALLERASTQGVAIASIANSNHIGMLGFYADRVAEADRCLIAFSTSEALVHPWGGRRAMIGTNPIAIGLPTGNGPFMMDTATSVVSMGEVHDHANRGAPIPLGWAVDGAGNPTTDAQAARRGAIAPFGQAKGYALGLAFELLVTSLAGAAIGRDVKGTLDSSDVANKADLFIVIDQDLSPVYGFLEQLRAEAPADGFEEVRIPGERGRELRQRAITEGVQIADVTWNILRDLAGEQATSN
ncbi:dehydrogenase [Devosia pacifica]|uniref:Dehydrogenase n=1 Tax=Devosia pacifica TaxID=1335967 RepID=A0A918VSK7_9HYPH|nr:Ldh family oxidoreductase [Devosia pacifica]GHA18982.1 dehydrogenase [Devosia pacifica]